jgi:hypothetical protein
VNNKETGIGCKENYIHYKIHAITTKEPKIHAITTKEPKIHAITTKEPTCTTWKDHIEDSQETLNRIRDLKKEEIVHKRAGDRRRHYGCFIKKKLDTTYCKKG